MADFEVWTGDMHREYGLKRLSRADLDVDPILQFSRWFEEGKDSVLEPNAMCLATADASGSPSVRMVLMKSFDEGGIVFATNYDSRKGREIAENPGGAVLFYWPALERQVRIGGHFEKTSAEESERIFQSRHPKSRIAARISRQSEPVANRETLEREFFLEVERFSEIAIERPNNWGGYRLVPVEFEFWQGGENRLHDRFVYRKEGARWAISRLQP